MSYNQHAVVYHRYNLDLSRRKVWEDTHCPILASIATLRAVNRDIKIYVLDTEPFLEDWSDFPSMLDFHVIQQPMQIPVKYEGGHAFQTRMVSRIWDVWNFAKLISEPYVIYTDSDVMWLKNPLPLGNTPTNHFYGDTRGDGFFYFNSTSFQTEVFVNTWMSGTLGGILSDNLRTKMRIGRYHGSIYLCEMAYCYLIRNGMTAGWGPVDPLEHYFLNSRDEAVNPDARCYHCHSGQFGSDRLSVARRVVEFSEAIRSTLPKRNADLLLGGVVPDTPFVRIADLMSPDLSQIRGG